MNFLQKMAGAVARKSAQFAGKSFTMSDAGPWDFGNSTYTGKSVSERTAMQVSTVWACVRVLAEGVGQLPWAIYEKDKRGDLTKVDHPLGEVLIDSPNADMTSNEMREAQMTNLGLRGNAFTYLEWNATRNRINSMTPVQTCNVKVRRRVDGHLVDATAYGSGELVYQLNDRGRWEGLPAEKIWHNRIFSLDGVNGLNPIAHARETIGMSMALEEFGSRIFSQGLHAGVIFKYPQWMPDDKRTLMENKIKTQWAGLQRTGNPFIAEGGMDVEQGILPPKDIEFLGLHGFGVEELCRLYLMSPHRVAHLAKMTNNNIEQLSLEFVMYTLLPYIVKIERSADRRLFNARDRGRFVLRFNYDGLLRGDSEARAKLESVWLQNGVVNRNEVRALERLPRSAQAGMDDFTVQSNMISVDDLVIVADAMRQRGGSKIESPVIETKSVAAPEAHAPAPVQIQLTSFDASLKAVADAVAGMEKGQTHLANTVRALAKSHENLHDATTSIAEATVRNAQAQEETVAAMKRVEETVGAEREVLLDEKGNVRGARIKRMH